MENFSEYNLDFIKIPAGSFIMGSSYDVLAEISRQMWQAGTFWESSCGSEWPQHLVNHSFPFYLATTPITLTQYALIMDRQPPQDKKSYPMLLNWKQTMELLEKLNLVNDLYTFRLPTEAEWEYSCKAGSDFEFIDHDDPDLIEPIRSDNVEFVASMNNGCEDSELKKVIHEVKRYPANDFGLYDMLGNVPEWCSDYFCSDYYYVSPHTDPKGPKKPDDEEKLRVVRGAPACNEFWSSLIVYRASCRLYLSEIEKNDLAGVRLVAVSKKSEYVD